MGQAEGAPDVLAGGVLTVELYGGPLDGRRIARARFAFSWIDTRRGNIVYSSPGKSRVLYRKVRPDTLVFAGHTHALCGGCGVYHERMDGHVAECSLCGGSLVR